MNPEKPMTPREELEVRVTALLMGELPPEEAEVLEAQIAVDQELRTLHERLRRAVELLREASAMPEQPAPPMPATLSEERRKRLLEHFKVVTPLPSAAKPRRNWKWIVPLGLAASLIALLGGVATTKMGS
jgi:anti-sigma factor RsiW